MTSVMRPGKRGDRLGTPARVTARRDSPACRFGALATAGSLTYPFHPPHGERLLARVLKRGPTKAFGQLGTAGR